MTTMRDVFFEVCRRTGLTTWFGNPGSTELRMFRDWPADFEYVLAPQETAVTAIAAGHAIATGEPVLVSLHSAGGVGHAQAAIFAAYKDRVPLVIIAGQQTRAMLPTRPMLSADEPALFPRPYVKWSRQPERAADVPAALAEAYRVAITPPQGPVFLSVPEDDWDAPGEPVPDRALHAAFGADPAALREVADALNEARSPVLIAGPGIDEDGAWAEATELAERLRAPVWAPPMARRAGFPEDHPLFQGSLPPLRAKVTALLEGHDVVLVLGAPVFTYHVHTDGPFLPAGARLFHLDCDPAGAAWAAVGTSVLTTVRSGTAALLDLVKESDRPGPPARERATAPEPRDPLNGAMVVGALSAALPADVALVEEAPTHKDVVKDLVPVTRPGSYGATGSGVLGWGLPVAVGRALAASRGLGTAERVVAVLGDGASMYSIQALWTAAQHRVPLTVLVLNNGGYAAVRALGRRFGIPDIPGTRLPELDIVAIATGFGCAAARVTQAAELPAALDTALRHEGPYVLDVSVVADDATLY